MKVRIALNFEEIYPVYGFEIPSEEEDVYYPIIEVDEEQYNHMKKVLYAYEEIQEFLKYHFEKREKELINGTNSKNE